MSCKWCENVPSGRKSLRWPGVIYYDSAIQEFMMTARPYNNGKYLSFEHDHFIKYCPNCGKKLELGE